MNTTCHLTRENRTREGGRSRNAIVKSGTRAGIGKRVQKGNEAMTAMLMERKCQISRQEHSRRTAEQTREEAVDRLVYLLEHNAAEYAHVHIETVPDVEDGQELSQMARLSAAHAAYALANNSKLRRVSLGAWLHERHLRAE